MQRKNLKKKERNTRKKEKEKEKWRTTITLHLKEYITNLKCYKYIKI